MIAQLQAVLPVPAQHGAAPDWTAVEAALRTALPPDYRDYVETYGAGRIAGFLWVFVPGASHDTIDLLVQAPAQAGVLGELRAAGEAVPFDDLLAVGMTDNGDVLYWRMQGAPADWTIVVRESRGPDFVAYATDLTGFVAGILDCSIRSPAFPADFPPGRSTFEPK